jgi:hypothetical protein
MFLAVNFCAIAMTINRGRFGKLTRHKFPYGNYQACVKWGKIAPDRATMATTADAAMHESHLFT